MSENWPHLIVFLVLWSAGIVIIGLPRDWRVLG
jgi:hypothetical protein